MTHDEMQAKLTALLNARFAGVRTVSYDGRQVSYASDGELAAAIADLERRIASLSGRRSRVSRSYAVKDL
ncbi:MAG: hypothetical protein CVT83_04855 [Alphaproteobacteria bacterium HGW-Alphaproteobacteria-5]|nr:MAG: hypothetical protein CVT83_04855 [Alphaproteobacteria bacterium HGW-Alphaproteobacteria-5]